ncbi:arfaptin-like domain-containing protein [Ditylenchus destructor]|nr:arfaptin-like domain-containing protein [Ditylenchus destructor]
MDFGFQLQAAASSQQYHCQPNQIRLIADVAEIQKDEENHIGVAIGGGAPFCPCLYVVQVFEGSPAAKDNRVKVGDEILSVNGIGCKGQDKTMVAALIRQSASPIRLSFNKLQFDVEEQSQTLEIALKKFKHWMVESMDPKTADALGLSRAILCNDLMSRLMDKLETNANFYKQLVKKCQDIAKSHYHISLAQDSFGSAFCEAASRETATEDQELFAALGECHKAFRKEQANLVSKMDNLITQLQNYATKAIPDTQKSIRKYLDAKFEYLSFCLKMKELEDEEAALNTTVDYLPRLESGNYEYRVMLRCRENARVNFIEMRKHVMVKIELLDEKHVRELALQLRSLMEAMTENHKNCRDLLRKALAPKPAENSSIPEGNDSEYNEESLVVPNLIGNFEELEIDLFVP